MTRTLLLMSFLALFLPTLLHAGAASSTFSEAVRYIMGKFGREATAEFGQGAAQAVTRQMQNLAAKYGEETVIEASRKVGPRVFRLVEEVGESGAPKALKLMARRGDDAIWIVSRPKSMSIFLKYGDNAADAMIRHREIAEGLIESYGAPMTRALVMVNGQNGRRLSMLNEEAILAKLPHRDEVLDAIGKHGDKAMDWVWRNKGAITVGAVAAAFVSNPEPFINGAVEVVDIGGETLIRPLAEAAAKAINWNLFAGVALAIVAFWVSVRLIMRHRRKAKASEKIG